MNFSPISSSPNPNPSALLHLAKPMSAQHFMRALSRIYDSATGSSPSSDSDARRTTGQIRRAAYASMAYSAGRRNAWSRALLRRLRRRAPRQGGGGEGSGARLVMPRRRVRVMMPAARSAAEPNRAETLRQLVPGGMGMDYCSLLEETADYIRCLDTQVKLMQTIADSIST